MVWLIIFGISGVSAILTLLAYATLGSPACLLPLLLGALLAAMVGSSHRNRVAAQRHSELLEAMRQKDRP